MSYQESVDEENYRAARIKLLQKFGPDWIKKMNYSALAQNVYHALLYKNDPFGIIEQLIGIIDNQSEVMTKLMQGAQRPD